jgi:hypothetical protein
LTPTHLLCCPLLALSFLADLQGIASAGYDVVVLGGTLGILLATALLAQNHQQQQAGGGVPLRVAVVERGKLQGRQQEWNVSHKDLKVRAAAGARQCRAAVDRASMAAQVAVGVAE